jgi:hypothetical protein
MDRGCSHLATAGTRGNRTHRLLLAVLMVLGATVLLGQPTAASAKAKKRECKKAAVATEKAVQITPVSAVLEGSVNTCGANGFKYRFVVSGSPGGSKSARSDRKTHAVSESLAGLTPGEQVTFQVELRSKHHTVLGKKLTFTTPSISVATLAATSVTTTSAALNASVNGDGAAGLSVAFVWSAAGGSQQTTPGTPLPADAAAHTLTLPVNTLRPGAVYTFDVVVSSSKGPLVQCNCALTFTTLLPPPTSLTVTAPASSVAGLAFTVSATGTAGSFNLGDVTAKTTFTITPDGSCTGASCTAPTLGPHTVHALDGAATGTAPTTVDPDHLVLSPATDSVCPLLPSSNHADFSCGATSNGTTYTAEAFDHLGNDLGDVTSSTVFGIGPSGECDVARCDVGGGTGDQTVTGTDGTAQGTATLTGVEGTMSCEGENYDVNNDTTDGCEVADSPQGNHTVNTAANPGGTVSQCDDGTLAPLLSGTILSDARAHQEPAILGFDASTGSAPDWEALTTGSSAVCSNDIVLSLSTTGEASAASNGCYKLTVMTDLGDTYSAQTDSSGSTPDAAAGSIDHDSGGQFSDGSVVKFEVQKTCGTSVREDVSWTISGHF